MPGLPVELLAFGGGGAFGPAANLLVGLAVAAEGGLVLPWLHGLPAWLTVPGELIVELGSTFVPGVVEVGLGSIRSLVPGRRFGSWPSREYSSTCLARRIRAQCFQPRQVLSSW